MVGGEESRFTEAVGAALVAGSCRYWSRHEPRMAEALHRQAEEWRARSAGLLAAWLSEPSVATAAEAD